MVPQADNVARMKLHLFLEHLAVPRDQRALARVERGGADTAVALKAAVPWKDVGGEEDKIGL